MTKADERQLGLIKRYLVRMALNGTRQQFLLVCDLFVQYPELVYL